MKKQGVHPEDAEGTSDSSSRPDTAVTGREKTGRRSGGGPSATAADPEDVAHIDEVEGDEPLLPARVHRPSDLMRLLVGVLAVAVLLAVAAFAHGTTSGLEQDINKGTGQAPDLLIKIAGLASSIAILLVPVAFAIERLIKRDGLRIADGVLAAVLAHGVTLATDLWVAKAAPGSIQEALTQPSPGDIHALTDPVHGYLAPVIAYMTAVGMSRRPRWRAVLWIVLLLDAFSMLVTGYTTPFSIILTVLIGWTVAYGTLYSVGSPNVRPTGRTLMAGLRTVGFHPVTAAREEVASDTAETGDRGRRYFVTLEDGRPLDVTVVDREQQAQGFFYRAWRNLTLRGFATRSSLPSLRQALEQEALLAYAAIAAGANAPKLIATSELGPDAVMLVYEHTGGRTLDSLSDEEITDELLRGTWEQVRALQSRRIAHRRLVGDAILVDRSGTVILTDLRIGEIAAGDLLLRMDVSQLLVTLGLRVGAERAVASAVAVLGPDAVADCLPMLQPIALSRSTRATLRRLARERAQREREAVLESSRQAKLARAEAAEAGDAHQVHEKTGTAAAPGKPERPEKTDRPEKPEKADKKAARAEQRAEKRAVDEAIEEAREEDLLTQIRHAVLRIRPQAPVEPARLERVRPRTLISFIAGAIGAYFLLTQLTHIEFGPLIANAEWGWVAAAVLFSAASYVAAAMSLLGFVPERVPFLRTVAAQVAGSFVKIVAPAAGRRRGPEHPVPAARRRATGARGGECRCLAALRARLSHPHAALLRLPDRHREDPVPDSVEDRHRGPADGGGPGARGDLRAVPAEVRRHARAVAVRGCRAAHAGRTAAAAEADHRHRRDAAAHRLLRDVPGRVDPRLRRRVGVDQPGERRGRLPRGQRAGVRGAHAGRCGRGGGDADGRSDRRGPAQGGRRPGGASVPAAHPVAAGAPRLAVLQPPDAQRGAVTLRRTPRTSYGSRPERTAAHGRTMDACRTPPGCAPPL